MRTTIAILSVLTLAALAFAGPKEKEIIPKSSKGWPITVLSKPFHVGDHTMKDFANPEAEGTEIRKKFELDTKLIPSSVYVGVWVGDLVTRNDNDFKNGSYQTKLLLNGKLVQVLNRKLSGKESLKIKKLVIRVDRKYLQTGMNELVIKAGGKSGNLDDFEVHRVIIDRNFPK